MKNSLSSLAKSEILKQEPDSRCCGLAFLSAVIHTAGSLLIGGHGKLGVVIKSVNPLLKKALDKCLEKLYGATTVLRGGELTLHSENIMNILLDCGILKQADVIEIVSGIDKYLTERKCCAAAYVGGAFVGCGSLSATKSGYHLEFASTSRKMADDLILLLFGYGITAKYIERKEKHIVYLKENESVSDCLTLAGAQRTALHISGMYVDRQVRQQSNRRFNCDIANLDRAVAVGVRQADLFLTIIDKLKDEKLIATAKARVENHDASYEELAEILGISKSGIKHRLKKLEDFALDEKDN